MLLLCRHLHRMSMSGSCSEVGAGIVRAVLQDMISQKLCSPDRSTHRFTLSSTSDGLDTLVPL